ncbi:S53 family peptidase [Paraburkholderia sp. ZP32-5]|uniref:S53 family peptidase n=1 Tax=Paraburkholderia sp. ZP32-5 TaxID=2883245 RepID=UPI001F2E2637|nr:S53 family peptidase [Paraburkholderia sp. ZP32-5]
MSRKLFHDSIAALPAQPGPTPNGLKVNAKSPAQDSDEMKVTFALGIDDKLRQELESRVEKGDVVPISELNSKYAVPQSEVDPLVAYLKTQGFKIDEVSNDRTRVVTHATVKQIESSLQVNMVQVTRDGITYTVAKDAPSLPSDVSNGVHAILGLQPCFHAHKHFRRITPTNRFEPSNPASKTGEPTAAPNIANSPPYLVGEILKAYNAAGLNLTGKGQIIAILIDTFPADSDLQKFWQRNGLATTINQVTKINVNGVTLPQIEGEETLDAEWTSGIAPDAQIRIYASGTLQFADLDRALDRILADLAQFPAMRQLSVSLGLGETFMQQGIVRSQHQRFLRLAAAGVNVFVSTGDAGSNPDSTGHASNGPLQVEFSSSDPCVVGVGGTTLVLASNGTVSNETGWADGGGGKSILFQRPSWQQGDGVPAGTNRLVPDVSVTADPNDGALVILHGKPAQIGGTSWSAPIWAGFCALINEARQNAGKPLLPFLNPLIYSLKTNCFRDIVSGSNGVYTAGKGYDMVTGLGVPDVKALVRALS